jgi:hypothetical protein
MHKPLKVGALALELRNSGKEWLIGGIDQEEISGVDFYPFSELSPHK